MNTYKLSKHRLFNHLLGLVFGLVIVMTPVVVLAQTEQLPTYEGPERSIIDFLCTPSESGDPKALSTCINRLYRFGITAGGIVLVFFIVLAGYFYITGGESGKTKGKTILQNALIGIAILLGSYVLLRFINPNLAMFRAIQPPIFDAKLPSCEEMGFESQCLLVLDGSPIASNSSGVFGEAYDKAKSAALATAILSDKKINTGCYGGSWPESARVKANLEDAAKSQPASTNSRGKTYLHQDMLAGIKAISNNGISFCVSAIAGGGHSDNSRHYVGLGFDIAIINGQTADKDNSNSSRVMEICRKNGATEVLGPLRPDPGHKTHVHCGWPRPK